MSWVVIALVSAALMGFVSIIDKTAHGYGRSPLTLPLLMSITQTTIGVVVLVIVGIPEDATLEEISIAVLSGFLFGVGVVTCTQRGHISFAVVWHYRNGYWLCSTIATGQT